MLETSISALHKSHKQLAEESQELKTSFLQYQGRLLLAEKEKRLRLKEEQMVEKEKQLDGLKKRFSNATNCINWKPVTDHSEYKVLSKCTIRGMVTLAQKLTTSTELN